MKRPNLISLITTAIATLLASGVNAQERLVDNANQNSIGPAIEFGGGGTSFGIKGKIGVSPQFSIRPMILFGYKPIVNRSDVNQLILDAAQNSGVDAATAQSQINTSVGQSVIDTLSGSVGSGTAYGLAATYDFTSPDRKLSGYIGPRILFGSASGSGNASNGAPFTTSTSETNIGLLAGADYAISDNFILGLNGTYNFSRSGTFSVTDTNGSSSTALSGGNFKFGVNVGYSF